MRKSFAQNGPKRWPICSLTVLKLNSIATFASFAILFLISQSGSLGAQTHFSLEEAIRLSGEHSYIVASAYSDSLGAIYDLSAARAMRYPTASLSATSFYINKLQSANLPLSHLTIGSHNNYLADIRLSLPLWTGGRIAAQIDMQSTMVDIRGANLEATRLANAYYTRKAYLGLLQSELMVKASDATLARVKLIGEDTQNRYANGLADSVDLLEADLAIQRAFQTQDEKTTASGNARALLARLVGFASDSITISESVPDPDNQIYQNQRPSKESINRPELTIQENRIKTAKYAVSMSRANYFPTLSGFGGYSVGKPNKDMFQNKWNDYWITGLNFNWDFNLGNKTGKNILSARQAVNSIKSAKEDLEDALLLQAVTTYDNLLQAFRSNEISKRQYEIARKKYALGQEKQRAGNLSLYRLLELEQDLSSSEQLYRASTINYYISEAEYLYAIGSPKIYGGFVK